MRYPFFSLLVNDPDRGLKYRNVLLSGLDQDFYLELKFSGNNRDLHDFGKGIEPETAL